MAQQPRRHHHRSFKSFTKKGRREQQAKAEAKKCNSASSSPIVYRKVLNGDTSSSQTLNRSTTSEIQSPSNRYIYSGSVTPLPRSRASERGTLSDFQTPPAVHSRRTSAPGGNEPLPSVNELKIENHGSQSSLVSTITLENSSGSIRASTRKKRRAPPPPQPRIQTIPDTPQIIITDTTQITTLHENPGDDIDIDDPSLHIELKIVEENDTTGLKEIAPQEKTCIEVATADGTVSLDAENKTVTVNIEETENNDCKLSQNLKSKEEKDSIVVGEINAVTLKCADKDCAYEDIKIVLKNIEAGDSPVDLFPKVDIITYKKQLSLESEQTMVNDDSLNKMNNNFANNNIVLKTEVTQELTNSNIDDNAENNNIVADIKDGQESTAPEIQTVKCKVVELQGKQSLNNARSEFFEELIEKARQNTDADEIVIREKGVENNNKTYQRRTVSDMKLLFDNPKPSDWTASPFYPANSPNPIPKPRRVRIGSKTSSSSESNQAETPNSDHEDKLSLKL